MKKILSFILLGCLLSIGNLWAVDPDFESYDWSSQAIAEAVLGTHGNITIANTNSGSLGNVSGHWYIPINDNLKSSDETWKYFSIASTQQIDSISVFYCPNGTNQTAIGWVAWGENITPNQFTLAHGVTNGTKSSKAWASAVWEKIDLSSTEAYTVYLSKSAREFREIGGTSNLPNIGGGQTINVLGIRVWLHNGAPAVKHTVTYDLNGGTGTLPTQNDVAEGGTFSVASANNISKDGYRLVAWNDGTNDYAPGSTYTMGTENVTLTAVWEKACYNPVYDFVGGVGNAAVKAADATVTPGVSLVLSNTNGRIKLIPASGEKFKNGDKISFSGTVGNTSRPFGIKVYAANNSTSVGTFSVAGAEGTINVSGMLSLTANQDSLFIARDGGTTTTLTSLVISELGECPQTYTVTYHSNGSGEANVVDDEAHLVGSNPFTYADHIFTGWNTAADGSGDSYNVGGIVNSDLELYAQWQAAYTVSYYFGSTLLHSEQVYTGENPAEYATAQTKVQSATFNGWYKDAALTIAVADISAEVISANTPFYGSFTTSLLPAGSINIEQLVLDNGKSYSIMAQMGTLHYSSNITGDLDSLSVKDDGKRNYAYLGLKVKKSGGLLNFLVEQGNTVKVKFGNVGKTPQVSINGSDYANMTITDKVYTYTATSEDAIISIKMMSDDAVVLKQIKIGVAPEFDIVALPVKLGTNGWLTFAADYKYTVSGATVYIGAVNGAKDAVILTEVENAVVPANAGIILKGTEGELAYITESSATASDFSGNQLVGVVAKKAKNTHDNAYVISTNDNVTKFNPCDDGIDIPANKAYIVIADAAAPDAIRIEFAEDNATNIQNVETNEKAVKFIENGKLYIQKDGVVYDAMGKTVR